MYRQALNEALREEMRQDPTVFLLGEGIAERGGSYQVTAGLLEEFGPKRVIDTPIAEASFTGAAIGAALTGMHPVVEILFVDFSMLVMDQIVNQAAKLPFMTGNQCTVPLVLRTQGGTGNGVAAQHSQSLEALFYHVPGLRLAVPSTPADAKGLLKTAIRDDSPVIFVELILKSVRKTQHVVIVQEAVRRGGVASDIASIIQEQAFDYLDAPIAIVAGVNTPIPYNLELEKACVPQKEQIMEAVRRSVARFQ